MYAKLQKKVIIEKGHKNNDSMICSYWIYRPNKKNII